MYIDKIYTKLYSNKDWNELDQLVNEIKQFTRANDEWFEHNKYLKDANKAYRHEAAKRLKEIHGRDSYNPQNAFRHMRNARNEALDSYAVKKNFKDYDHPYHDLYYDSSSDDRRLHLDQIDNIYHQANKWDDRKWKELRKDKDDAWQRYADKLQDIDKNNPVPDGLWDRLTGKRDEVIDKRKEESDKASRDYDKEYKKINKNYEKSKSGLLFEE